MLKRILFSLFLAAGCLSASAQAEEMKETVNPHWYALGQVGVQADLGETSFGKLVSPSFQLGGGYQFNSLLGARFTLSGYQSKAGTSELGKNYSWKWNYLTPEVDATLDLTNLIGGYKHRCYSVGVFAGVGLNIAFNNGEAAKAQQQMVADHMPSGIPEVEQLFRSVAALSYLWDGSTARVTARGGANVDFHVTPRLDVGAEVSATTLRDTYNSRRAGNSDWYFNAFVGVKYHFGEVTKMTRKKIKEEPIPAVVKIKRILDATALNDDLGKVEMVKVKPVLKRTTSGSLIAVQPVIIGENGEEAALGQVVKTQEGELAIVGKVVKAPKHDTESSASVAKTVDGDFVSVGEVSVPTVEATTTKGTVIKKQDDTESVQTVTPVVPEKTEPEKVAPFRRDVFYRINQVEVPAQEMPKVEEISAYLKANPSAKLQITGYADKGTGTASVNARYARKRAETLRELLIQKFGVDASRITADSKGDTEQPFDDNDSNRVCITIAE